jgi:preprotein translocase subunit YajC
MTVVPSTLQAVLLAATSSKSSSSSVTFIIFLVVIGLVGYFLLLRPQQQKARRQRATQSEIDVGDEILTVGGIVGTVLDIDTERVTIVTGVDPEEPPGSAGQATRMVLVRNAIARKIEPVVAPDQDGIVGVGTGHPGYGGVEGDDDDEGRPGGAHDDTDDQDWSDGGSKEGGEP